VERRRQPPSPRRRHTPPAGVRLFVRKLRGRGYEVGHNRADLLGRSFAAEGSSHRDDDRRQQGTPSVRRDGSRPAANQIAAVISMPLPLDRRVRANCPIAVTTPAVVKVSTICQPLARDAASNRSALDEPGQRPLSTLCRTSDRTTAPMPVPKPVRTTANPELPGMRMRQRRREPDQSWCFGGRANDHLRGNGLELSLAADRPTIALTICRDALISGMSRKRRPPLSPQAGRGAASTMLDLAMFAFRGAALLTARRLSFAPRVGGRPSCLLPKPDCRLPKTNSPSTAGLKSFRPSRSPVAYLRHPARVAEERPADGDQVEFLAVQPAEEVVQAGGLRDSPPKEAMRSPDRPTEPTLMVAARVSFFAQPAKFKPSGPSISGNSGLPEAALRTMQDVDARLHQGNEPVGHGIGRIGKPYA